MNDFIEQQILEPIRETWRVRRAAIERVMETTAEDIEKLIASDRHQREAHDAKHVQQGMGRFADGAVDSRALAGIETLADRTRLSSPDRMKRVKRLLKDLRSLRDAYSATPPDGQMVSLDKGSGDVLDRCERHLRDMARTFRLLRMGQLEINARYLSEQHDYLFQHFDWRDMTMAERELCPPFVVLVQQAADTPVPVTDIMRLLSSGYPLKVIAVRTVREIASPVATGVPDIEYIPMMLRGLGMAQLVSGETDYVDRVARAVFTSGPALISVLVPGASPQDTVRAVASRAFPVVMAGTDHHAEPGFQPDLSGNPDPGEAWAGMERAGSGNAQPYTFAEFVAETGYCPSEFSDLPDGCSESGLMPLVEYLKQRVDKVPYIETQDGEGGWKRVVPSEAMINRTLDCQHRWRLLQRLAGAVGQPPREPVAGDETARPAHPTPDQAVTADIVRRLVAGLTGVSPDAIHLETTERGT